MMQGLICLLHVGRVLRPAVGLPSLLSKEPLFFVDDDGQSLCNQKVIPSPSFAVKKNDAVVLACEEAVHITFDNDAGIAWQNLHPTVELASSSRASTYSSQVRQVTPFPAPSLAVFRGPNPSSPVKWLSASILLFSSQFPLTVCASIASFYSIDGELTIGDVVCGWEASGYGAALNAAMTCTVSMEQ